MAFTEFTCRSGGSNLYAGTLDGSAEASTTPLVTYASGSWVQSTRVFTVASGDPVAAGVTVGMFASVYPDGTSGSTVYVGRISNVTTTTITISTAVSGTAPTDGTSNRTLVVGGAWQGPNGTVAFPFGFITNALTDSSNNRPRVNIKNDQTYSITAAINHGNAGPILFQGYTSTFGDGGRFILDGGTSGASYVLLTFSNFGCSLADGIFRNNGATSNANGVVFSVSGNVFRCVFHSIRGNGLSTGAQSNVIQCEAYSCNQSNTANTAGFISGNSTSYIRCVSHDNSGTNSSGFVSTAANVVNNYVNCIADTNGQHGWSFVGSNCHSISNCTAYGNTTDGIRFNAGSSQTAQINNSIFASNGGWGINSPGTPPTLIMENNAFHNNTSGQMNGLSVSELTYGTVTLTGDPFVAPTTGDFDLNNTAGAGAACRGTGIGTFTQTQAGYSGTLSYPDIGASQHQDTGGSTINNIIRRIRRVM